MRIPKTYRRYDKAFREGALALLKRSDRTMRAVAEGLGVPVATLQYWYKSAEMAKRKKLPTQRRNGSPGAMAVFQPDPISEEERIAQLEAEVAALRKENEELKEDRAILKKAAAFFAKESE
jgi:transposase